MGEKLPTASIEEFKKRLVTGLDLIDVRAPVEFAAGAIPGSLNLPILDDQERADVGTTYKQQGQEKAIALGYEIVSGENKKQKVQRWLDFIHKHPHAMLTCFRGGLRSQITQKFLAEAGARVPRLQKGYKQARQLFLNEVENFCQNQQMILLTGLTGSAKTNLLTKVSSFYPAVDLERLALHRGSAFGRMKTPQPSQASFENALAIEIIRQSACEKDRHRPILFEDESRLIGIRHLPENFFNKLRSSKVIVVKQTLEERIENIFQDYVVHASPGLELFLSFEVSLDKIQRRLGGLRTQEIRQDIHRSRNDFATHQDLNSNKIWIEKLLVFYYDPLYLSSFERRNPEILFQGRHEDIQKFLTDFFG